MNTTEISSGKMKQAINTRRFLRGKAQEILAASEYKDVLKKQIKNGVTSSGRIFVPKKYVGMDAIVIIYDKDMCPYCKGTGTKKH